jgi:hypothetical protein
MKTRTLVQAALVAAVAIAPALSFAQETQAPKTRAEVRAELVELERAGYNPSVGEDVNYPADIQAAEARVQQQHVLAQEQQGNADTGYGSATTGTSQSGAPQVTTPGSVYFGH